MINEKPKILIVDDDISTIRLIGELLNEDYEVSFATSAEQALDILNENTSFDTILLDIKLPGIDGYSACSKLKQQETTQKIPIIFVTSCSRDFEEAFGFRLGAVDYVTKPISSEILKARIKTHVTLYQQTQKLEELSCIDSLTNIANRRHFDEFLQTNWKLASRSQSAISLILMDVDNFKFYNDTYGHGMGDRCLEKIASCLKAITRRDSDLAARVGGEEFAIILPDTELVGAVDVAEKLKNAVFELDIPHKSSPVGERVTVSVGVVSTRPGAGSNPQELYIKADEELYKVKKSTKNGVSAKEV